MYAQNSNHRIQYTHDRQRMHRAWLIWFIAASFLLFQFFMQLTGGIILSGVKTSFHTDYFWATLILSSYYYIYVLTQVPAGMLVDRFGPRHLLSVGALTVAIGCFIFATTHHIIIAMCARLLMGGGAACAFVSCINLIKQWFPEKQFSLMTSLTEMFGMIGAIVGSLSLASTVEHFGWQTCTLGMGGIAIGMSLLIWLIVKDNDNSASTSKTTSRTDFSREIKKVLKSKTAWMNGAYSALMFGVIGVFVSLWGVKFYQATHNISLFSATIMDDVTFIGAAVACPIIGFIDSHTNWRHRIMWISPIIAAAIMVAIIFIPAMNNGLLLILLFILGTCLSPYILNFVIANQISNKKNQGINIGFVNMLSVGSAPIIQPLIGFMMDTNTVALKNHSIIQYQKSLWIIPVMLIIAAVVAYYLPRNNNYKKV